MPLMLLHWESGCIKVLARIIPALPCGVFTGIVETSGVVRSIAFREGGARFIVEVGPMARELSLGESVAVNGCCLTVTEFAPAEGTAAFDLLNETLRVTS